jgi:ABC-2 family transporter protein
MSLNLTARLNPEILRSLRVSLPPKRVLFIAVLTNVLLFVVGGVFWNQAVGRKYLSSAEQLQRFGSDMFWLLTLALLALLFVLTPATAALSFIQEKIRGTAIFQQMVLLSPFDLALGKFVGSGLIGYFVAALVYPFFMLTALLGDVSLEKFVRISLLLLVGGLCCQAVGLFVSSALSGPGERFVRGGLLIGPAVGGLGALTAIALYRLFDPTFYFADKYERWHFYGVELKPYIVVLNLMIFAGVWAFVGTVRRIKASQLIPVRPWPVWLFLAMAEAVLTGLFWGGFSPPKYDLRIFEFTPGARLIFYLFLNWAAFVVLAGSSALGRERLREWWSASSDPLALFQRREIKNALTTFLLALAVSLAGLAALWASFHTYTAVIPPAVPSTTLLASIAVCFALTVTGMAVFIQYCAMQRFRIGAWAGVVLTITFYLVLAVIGASFEDKKNTAALMNPMIYADAVTEGYPYVDVHDTFGVKHEPNRDATERTLIHGLVAQGLLAAGCFGLAYVKWRKTEEEIMQEST